MEGNTTLAGVRPGAITVQKKNLLMLVAAGMILIGVGGGVYAQITGHHHAFATTRAMPWGMPIGVYAYFAIISTGLCLMAALAHLFHIERLEPLANRLVWVSIIMLLAAFLVIGLEIENPWRMPINVILYPNLTSNIWWMGTLYGLAVGVMFLEFVLIVRRKFKVALVLGGAAAVAEMLANSNLGSVFASLAARPFWYGAQLPVFFLACALMSGAAAAILFTHYAHLLAGRKMDRQTYLGLRFAGKLMMILIFLTSLATGWKFANAYCGTEEMRLAADALVRGPLAGQFWVYEVTIGLVAPFVLLALTRLNSLQALSLSALLVLVGQFASRFNLVVGGLIVPQYPEPSGATTYLAYSPSTAEQLLVVGGLGVVGFGFLIGEKVFSGMFFGDDEG